MKQKEVTFSYTELDTEELNQDQQKAMQAAREAVKDAYSPYSNYAVGAALLLEGGQLVKGCNQENAVYPLGLCAERVAMFAAGATYPGKRARLLALTIASSNKPGFPCGSCRQSLVELENRTGEKVPVLIESRDGKHLLFSSVRDLLPFAFNEKNLEE